MFGFKAEGQTCSPQAGIPPAPVGLGPTEQLSI